MQWQSRYRQVFDDSIANGRLLRWGRFGLVGISGIFVNLFLHYLFADQFRFHYLLAACIATQGSTTWNFLCTERWVFGDRVMGGSLDAATAPPSNSLYSRFGLFLLLNNSALLLRGPLMLFLTGEWGVHYLTSNLFSLVAFTLLRYTFANTVIWKSTPEYL